MTLVHWISLHLKRATSTTILKPTPHLLGEKLKAGINNLPHQKAGSVAVILSLIVGVKHKQTVVHYFFQCGVSKM